MAQDAPVADHFVVALEVGEEDVLLHDPGGFPFARAPMSALLSAWRADTIDYGARPYHLRHRFRPVAQVSRQTALDRALPAIREAASADPGGAPIWGPTGPAIYGAAAALRVLAQELRGAAGPHMVGALIWFALPLAARRLNDAAQFLAEADCREAATHAATQARLFGAAQYPTVKGQWAAVADLMDEAARVHSQLLEALI